MNHKSKNNNRNKYISKIADYIDLEYDGFDNDGAMTDDEKHTIKNIIMTHYENDDSINNAANEIILYLRKNRNWKENNQ